MGNNYVKNAVKGICAAQKGQNGKAVGYTVTANGMPASQEAAPYLGHTQVDGTCEEDELEDLMMACGCELDKPAIGLVVTAASAYLVNNMPKAPNAFDCGFGRFLPVMDGTLPFKDSNFDPERNELHVAVQPSDAIRTALSGSSPRRLGATSPEPSILNVQSPGVRDADTIKADEPFDILGVRVTIGQGNERAEMELPDKTKVPVTLEAQAGETRQRIVGRFAQPVAACTNARLTLWTHGLRTEGAPLPVSRGGITILAGGTPPGPTPEEPVFTKVCGTGHEDDPAWTGKVARNGKLSIIGANLTDDLVVSLLYSGEYETEFDVDEVTPTMITGTISGGVEPGASYSFALKKPGGTVIGTAEVTCDVD